MIGHQLALIRREIWEHRSIYITPAAIALIVTLGVLAMLMFVSGFAKELDVAIFGAQNVAGDAERRAVLTGFFVGTSWVFVVALAILTVFYCLDSLYAERKDKSILFWRSMPVTDAETVISKLLTAVFVLPIIMSAGIFVTHLINLIITSLWVSAKGGDVGTLDLGFDIVVRQLGDRADCAGRQRNLDVPADWLVPVRLDLVEDACRLLMAFMPPILLALGEGIIFRSRIFL